MLSPVPMHAVSLQLLTEDVPLVAYILAEYGLFNPETTETLAKQLPERVGESMRQVFNTAQSRLNKILARISFTPPEASGDYQSIDLAELEQINAQLGNIWQQFSQLEAQLQHHYEQQTALKQLIDTLQLFSKLDVDLKQFQQPRQFLNLHIGTVALTELTQLAEALRLAEHLLHQFHQDEESAYVVIAGPLKQQRQVASILEHAQFQSLKIPPEFQSHPQEVDEQLKTQLQQSQHQIETLINQKQTLAQQHDETLQQAYRTLNQVSAYARLTEWIRGRGHLTQISGWIPQTDVSTLEQQLSQQLTHPFVLTHREPKPAEYAQVPSLVRHHRLLSPFITLVHNYGIPRYGEFDPTWLFTVTFILMFGAMFGDIGHGAVIAAFGWLLRHKLHSFTYFFVAAGGASIVFGALYGSIFGYETLLPALWLSPIHHPTLMLKIALYWGIGFILLATVITIINRWRQHQYAQALFNTTGIAGLLFYLGSFYALKQWMLTQQFTSEQLMMMAVPLMIILAYKGYEHKMPLTERLLVTLIEGLESIINYLANTLSFLRVAAFSLNHAALAIAVFTLADMVSAPANGLVIILGNIFIIVLEGFIVTIQVLRLEYYEGFSRFFSGDGRAFQPLTPGIR